MNEQLTSCEVLSILQRAKLPTADVSSILDADTDSATREDLEWWLDWLSYSSQ